MGLPDKEQLYFRVTHVCKSNFEIFINYSTSIFLQLTWVMTQIASGISESSP